MATCRIAQLRKLLRLTFFLYTCGIPSTTRAFFFTCSSGSARCTYRHHDVPLLQTRLFASSSSGKQQDQQRIDKLLANRGVGTRTEVTRMINQGKVAVNGQVVRSGAKKFSQSTASIIVEGIDGEIKPPPLLVIYHKPVGILSSMGDPVWKRPNLQDVVETHTILKGMHPVGRLDADTSGLLLFSSNGDLTQILLNPNSLIPREYIAVVEGVVDENLLRDVLAKGVQTTDGTFPAQLIEAKVLDKKREVTADFAKGKRREENSLEGGSTSEDNIDAKEAKSKWVECSQVRLSVCEGKYRMVRRLLHNAGHSVIALHRVKYGKIELDPGFTQEGDLRECSLEESYWARSIMNT